ncbi:nucleotidyltransferase [Idiomarina sp. WRN-38]|uniref:nucleotidyltransferase family protein n=2 Tax=unclassified Idiomarina TaxID=2614829 RepID=UPI0007337E4C|nr:nucleotidyltransferase domain-containing protein [Idiomarina sp. OXR-189]KTG24188.1 nucleotidyltransferase [Idiomarina sp. H105]OAE91579.1 nucleotidyltransferase [Idiomarina sp. WRN-38]WPZ02078.1 nucleotidyltransferase domain-containing protein [Idiomarina sp. OXR-189]
MSRLSSLLKKHRQEIQQIVEKHHAKNVKVFGSAVRQDDSADSDLDLLIETTPETTMFDIGAIKFELNELLGVEVDVLTPNSLPMHFKEKVEQEARLISP